MDRSVRWQVVLQSRADNAVGTGQCDADVATPTPQLCNRFGYRAGVSCFATTTGSTNDCDEDTKADYVGKYDS